MLPVKLIATGRALPGRKVTRSDLQAAFGVPDEVLSTDHGVCARYFCTDEDQISLAVSASQQALRAAGKTVDDIDLIIAGCGVPYQTIPSTAPLIMKALGLPDGAAMAFDVNSTCLSFVSGLDVAARMLGTQAARCALVISSEIASRALPWDSDPHTALLFGDGAAAAVLAPSPQGDDSALIASGMRTYPSAYHASQIGAGGTRFDFRSERQAFERHAVFEMKGRDLFRITARHFTSFLDHLLERAGWTRDSVDLVVPHQASPQALQHMIAVSGFREDQVMNIASQYGNQIAASIPFALDLAVAQARIARGGRLLLIGTSAGVSIGGVALEY